jgi:hypothetical protein
MVLLAALINPGTSGAATIRVPSEYTTIQAGINASTHGDTVLVAPGVYKGNGNRDIEFNGRRIVVRSEAGAENTIVDCEGTAEDPHRGFHFDHASDEALLQGFTIKRGYATYGSSGSQDGAGIRVNGLSRGPVIEDCVIIQCTGASAVYTYAPRTILRRCSIVDNQSKGVQVEVALRIEDCLISGNLLRGLHLAHFAEVLSSRIIGNDGCGVYLEGNEFAVIRDCLITGNRDIGVRAVYTTGLLIEGCTIVGNDGPAGSTGGLQLEIENQWATVRRCIIRGNCPNDVRVTSQGDLTFQCCAIDPSAVTGTGEITYDGPQVIADPMLCTVMDCEDAPTTEGDYHLQPGSPCLPESSPCGELIGALAEGCDVSSSPAPQEVAVNSAPPIWVETWPNPARDAVSIRLAIRHENGNDELGLGAERKNRFEIRIFTASGSECRRMVYTVEQLGSPVAIETRNLQPGVYFVRMRSANVEASGRFLIAR